MPKSLNDATEEFRTAFQMENMDGNGVTVKSMAAHLGLAERTVRNRIERLNGEFVLRNGLIQEAKFAN